MPPFDAIAHVMAPTSLADYTCSGLIVPELREKDAAGIISELSHVLQREGCVPDVLALYHAALNQELLNNSALDCGIAFPHARLRGVKQLQFALGRTPDRILWGAKGGGLVQFVFLLAVPATYSAGYLHLLSSLARMAQQPELLEELRAAEQAEGMLGVLAKIRIRQG